MRDKPRVLVVEDDPSWQEIYGEILNERDPGDKGYSVEMVGCLSEALDIIDSRFFHVAIVDLNLSEDDPKNRDGLEVLKHIWELDEGTAVMVASAYADTSMFEELRRYGVFGLAEKPSIVPDEVMQELKGFKFIKGSIDKAARLDASSIVATVDRALVEAQRNSVRAIWTESPFSFINGVSAREIQRSMGGGQMAELRPFLGDLCRPFMPWLQAKEKPTPIVVDEVCVGFQTPCWSRAIGKAIAIRFGRRDSFERALNRVSIDAVNGAGEVREELNRASSSHFVGVVYSLVNIDSRQHFKPPALKRKAEPVSAQSG